MRNEWGYVVDVVSFCLAYVVDSRRSSPTYGRRVAGPFAQEHEAAAWIRAQASK
jgi:hypothetical protein